MFLVMCQVLDLLSLFYRKAECGDHGQEDVVFHPREEQTFEQQDQHRPQQGAQVRLNSQSPSAESDTRTDLGCSCMSNVGAKRK